MGDLMHIRENFGFRWFAVGSLKEAQMRPKMERLATLWIMMVCFVTALSAQEHNPLIRKGSVGTPAATDEKCVKDGFVYRPITCWSGEKFIFLPGPENFQKYGYQDTKGGKGEYGHVAYQEGVGRIGTLTAIEKQDIGWEVTIKMDDNGKIYKASALGKDPEDVTIHGIAPLLDLQAARSKWLGKDLWLKRASLGNYDEAKGTVSDAKVPECGHVKVTDVVAGWYSDFPVRFIVKTDAESKAFMMFASQGPIPPKYFAPIRL